MMLDCRCALNKDHFIKGIASKFLGAFKKYCWTLEERKRFFNMAVLFGFLRSPRNSVEGYLGGHTGHREGDAGEEGMNQDDTC